MVARFTDEVAQRILDLLTANKATLLGVDAGLFYGDQDRLPTTPTVCIEAGPQVRSLAGAPAMVENQLECYILIYHSKVQDVQVTKKESELYAKAIAEFFDQRLQLQTNPGDADGVVIFGHCTNIDPGYAVKQGTLYSAVRITWNGKTKTRLGA